MNKPYLSFLYGLLTAVVTAKIPSGLSILEGIPVFMQSNESIVEAILSLRFPAACHNRMLSKQHLTAVFSFRTEYKARIPVRAVQQHQHFAAVLVPKSCRLDIGRVL